MPHPKEAAIQRESSSYKRRISRVASRLVRIGICIIFFVAILGWANAKLSPSQFRQTVIIVGDPLHIVSIDAKTRRVSVVDLPQNTVVPAALGYGKYAVGSLISLDTIDHRNGALLIGSIRNALGLPIFGYLTPSEKGNGTFVVSDLKRIFSLRSMWQTFTGSYQSSLSFIQWARLLLVVSSLSADAVRVVDITPALITVSAADGSVVSTLDENRLDYILDTSFFDTSIRNEGLSVAVYNTTDVASIGLRASRQLSRVGMKLVYIGNAENPISRCLLTGSAETLKSKTAIYIKEYFDCEVKFDSGVGRETGADLVMQLGTDFSDIYK